MASPRTVLSELPAAAERCTVVVVFADDFEDDAIGTHLDGIERWREGPTLLVVTDHSPPSWTPTRERVRPAALVTRQRVDDAASGARSCADAARAAVDGLTRSPSSASPPPRRAQGRAG